MNIQTFWDIVKKSMDELPKIQKNEEIYRKQAQHIINQLITYSESEIIDFERIFKELALKVYKKSIYEIMMIINYNTGYDCFEWFRSWLVFQGEEIYTKTMENPDDLADYIDNYEPLSVNTESYTLLANKAFIAKTKSENYLNYPAEIHSHTGLEFRESFDMDEIDFVDEFSGNRFPQLYPKLWKKFIVHPSK